LANPIQPALTFGSIHDHIRSLLDENPYHCAVLYANQEGKCVIHSVFHRCRWQQFKPADCCRHSLPPPFAQDIKVIYIDCSNRLDVQKILEACQNNSNICICELKDRVDELKSNYRYQVFFSYTHNGLTEIKTPI